MFNINNFFHSVNKLYFQYIKKEKHFKSNECGYASSHSVQLKQHVSSVHKKEMPFMCNKCNFQPLTFIFIDAPNKRTWAAHIMIMLRRA